MAVKSRYKIPYSITDVRLKAWVSLNISFHTKNSGVMRFGPKRQIRIQDMLVFAGVSIFTLIIGFTSPMKSAPLYLIPFLGASFGLLFYLFKETNTGERGYRTVIPTVMYVFQRKSRSIKTPLKKLTVKKRRSGKIVFSDDLYLLRKLFNFDAIDEAGNIRFVDGSYGHVLRISGRMSALNFGSDNVKIIDSLGRLQNQWSKEDQLTVVTSYIRQQTDDQQYAIGDYYMNLTNAMGRAVNTKEANPIVYHLLERRLDMLKQVSEVCMTSQQFLILKAGSLERIDELIHLFSQFVGTDLVFDSLLVLNREESLADLQTMLLGRKHELFDVRDVLRRKKKKRA